MGKRQQQVARQRAVRNEIYAIMHGPRPALGARQPLATPYDTRLHAAVARALSDAIDEAPPSVLESGALVVDLEVWATAVIDCLVGYWPAASP